MCIHPLRPIVARSPASRIRRLGLWLPELRESQRVVATPTVCPRPFELHHFDIQSTGQKSRVRPHSLRGP